MRLLLENGSGYSIEKAIRLAMEPIMVSVYPCRVVYGVFPKLHLGEARHHWLID